MFWFFRHKICEILAPWPGIEAAPPALEDEVLPLDHQKSPYSSILIL